MTPELAACVLEGLLLLHEELSVDPEAPWYVGTPDQTQVLHDELWLLAGQLIPSSSAALVETWYSSGRSALLPVESGPPESLSGTPLAAPLLPGLLAGHAPSRCPRPQPLPLISALIPT